METQPDFLHEKSLEQLVREQGARPLKKIAELAGIWVDPTDTETGDLYMSELPSGDGPQRGAILFSPHS